MLEWDNEKSAFKETGTGFYHNKDRCNQIKENKPITQQVTQSPQYQKEEKQLFGQQPQQQPISQPTMEQILLSQTSKKVDEINEKLEACYQLTKSNNDMLGVITQSLKITDPKSAAELYSAMQNTQEEALKKQDPQQQKESTGGTVEGWNSTDDSKLSWDIGPPTIKKEDGDDI
jgi:hypothetical protein